MSNVTPITAASQGGNQTATQKAQQQIRKSILPNGTYNPDNYYTHSGKDHRKTLRINFPREVVDALAIAAEFDANIRTPEAFIRNAVFHALHTKAAEIGATDSGIKASERMLRELQDRIERDEMSKELEAEEQRLEDFANLERLADVHMSNEDFHGMQKLRFIMFQKSTDKAFPPGLRARYHDVYSRLTEMVEAD